MTRRLDSASRRSCSDIEPIRSAKTTVTSFRAIAFSAASPRRRAPHAWQKRVSLSQGAPQAGQRGARGVPQPPQKRASAGFARPQVAQVMVGKGLLT